MIDWQDLQTRISGAIAVVRKNPVLDTAAKLALGSIPVVGERIVELYEDHGEKPEQEELLHVLRLLQGTSSEGFEELSQALLNVHDSLATARQSLRIVRDSLEQVEDRMQEVQASLDDAQSVLDRVAISLEGFDPANQADQLNFYLQLQRLLDDTKVWVVQQDTIGREILPRHLESAGGGLDDALMRAHAELDAGDRRLHAALRRATDRVSNVHRRMRSLLRSNPEMVDVEQVPLLRELDVHLAWWLAKYELLRESEAMCIVYVGAPPTNRPFPKGLDDQVREVVEKLRSLTRLDHFQRG